MTRKKLQRCRLKAPSTPLTFTVADCDLDSPTHPNPSSSTPLTGAVAADYESFGSPGTPPSTPLDKDSPENSEEPIVDNDESPSLALPEKYKKMKTLCAERTEYARYLMKTFDKQQYEMDEVVEESKRKIKSVRSFWRDKVYKVGLEKLSRCLYVKKCKLLACC